MILVLLLKVWYSACAKIILININLHKIKFVLKRRIKLDSDMIPSHFNPIIIFFLYGSDLC